MRKIKYYLYPVLLVICLYSCSSTDDDKQEPQPPIEIPDADELASIGVGLVAYYTFDNETGDDSSPNHYDAALINRPDIISDTPSNKGKSCLSETGGETVYQHTLSAFQEHHLFCKHVDQGFWSGDSSISCKYGQGSGLSLLCHPYIQWKI